MTSLTSERAKSSPRAAQLTLILLATSFTLLPLTVTTAYLAYRSLTEVSRIQNAPVYAVGEPSQQGTMVKAQGTFQGELLNPPDYPEVQNALWYRVVSERRPSLDKPWHRDTTTALVAKRTSRGSIGPLMVELGLLSRLALPLIRVEREVDSFHRLAIEYKTLPPANSDGSLVAVGFLEKKSLGDGLFERLLIFAPDQVDLTLGEIRKKGYRKGFFLGGISLIFLGLMFVAIPFKLSPLMGAKNT